MPAFAGIVAEELRDQDFGVLDLMLPGDSVFTSFSNAVLGAPASGGCGRLIDQDGRRCRIGALFSGRLENAAELRTMLEKHGHHIHGDTPEELLIHLYEKYGNDIFCHLKGRFAAAVYDPAKSRLLLGRDILGSEPLYYFIHRNILSFSNNLGVLERHPAMPRELDVNSVATFLSLQYIPSPDTIYRRVRKLPPGYLLEVRLEGGSPSIRSFDKIDFSVKRNELSFEDACAELRGILDRRVKDILNNCSGKAGVFLSGGVDSTILAALASRHAGDAGLDVFTVGFSDAAYDERPLAAQSVKFINGKSGGMLRHHLRQLEMPSLDFAANIAASHGEPYADVSVLPSAMLCSFAKENGVDTVLGGDGGDEFFAGYERYSAMRLAGYFDILPEGVRRGIFSALARMTPDSGERTFCGRARRMFKLIADSSRNAYYGLLDRCPLELKQRLFGTMLRDALWHDSGVFAQLEWELTSANQVESFSELDIRTYLPGDCCTKLKIASSFGDLEWIAPFLSSAVCDFSAKLPFEYKMKGNSRKHILKAAFADILPPDVVKQPKLGFGSPMASWFRSGWLAGVRDILFDSELCSGGYIERDELRRIWDIHQFCRGDMSYLLWSLVNFAWFLERNRK